MGWGMCSDQGDGAKSCLADLVLRSPRCQRRILVVVENRPVITGTSTLGGDTDVRDARILGAEIIRENIDVGNCFQRWLAVGRRAENTAVRALPIQSEIAAVTLRTEELESRRRGPLRDVGIQI